MFQLAVSLSSYLSISSCVWSGEGIKISSSMTSVGRPMVCFSRAAAWVSDVSRIFKNDRSGVMPDVISTVAYLTLFWQRTSLTGAQPPQCGLLYNTTLCIKRLLLSRFLIIVDLIIV